MQTCLPLAFTPLHTALQAVLSLGWSWDSFDTFRRPFLPPVLWTQCSRGWFLHQVRDALRQSQLENAASRCAHLAGFSVSDRHMTLVLLRRLQKQKQHYSAGTLKAILANAIKTAVVYHKAKLASSPLCSFCDAQVEETTIHMYEECSQWHDIRSRFPLASDPRLPVCTRFTGIACLSPQTLASCRAMDRADTFDAAPLSASALDAAKSRESFVNNFTVVVIIASFCSTPNLALWRRAGYSIRYSRFSHPGNASCALLGSEQTAQRALLRALLHVVIRDVRPLHIRVACSGFLSVWEVNKSPSPRV